MQILNQTSLAKSSILEKAFIFILCAVLAVNLMKPLMDFYLGIGNQTVTIFQFIILFLFYLVNKINRFTFSRLEWSLLLFLLMRYMIEIFISDVGLLQPTSSLMKFIILILGINYFINYTHREIFSRNLSCILWIYFMLTILISILQMTDSHIGDVFANYGGNEMSGNIYGITRGTGGIGGTVIDYAILIILYALLYTTYDNKGIERFLYLSSLIIASLLVFSRVVFLVFMLMLAFYIFGNVLSVKIKKSFIVMSIITILIAILMRVYYDDFKIYFVYDSASEASDIARINQWGNVFDDLGNTSYIIGNSMGRNTGFPDESVKGKLAYDGHFLAFLADYGILGLSLYVMYLLCSVYKAINRKKEAIIFVFILFTALNINSGFDKFFNIYIFPIILMVVRQNFIMRKRREQKPISVLSFIQTPALAHNKS